MKSLIDLLAAVCVLPLYVYLALVRTLTREPRPTTEFQSLGQLLSLVPGVPGIFLRRAFCRLALSNCGRDVSIGFGTLLTNPEAEIREGVYIGARCMVGLATIGADTLLGSNVDILSGKSQHFVTDPSIPIRHQGGTNIRVRIGEDVWLGNSSVVLADVGDHAIVAAGAVVVKPVEPWAIVGGNPAEVIGYREGRPSQAGSHTP